MGHALEVLERYYSLFDEGRIHDAKEMFAPGCVTVTPNGALDREGHEAMAQAFKAAFPDSHMEIEHVVEAGDEVVALGHFKGTHSGDLQGATGTIPASRRPLDLRFMDFFKIEGDRIVDHQVTFDQMEMLGQLGALPATEAEDAHDDPSGPAMPVIVHVVLPGVSPEEYDAVRSAAGWLEEAPVGGISHVTWWEDGDCHNIDAWESEAAFAAFGEDRLGPAMVEVGVSVEPQVTFQPAYEVYTPRSLTITG